ncbi:MAG: sigma-70 family RNA polymerase sigma factor [Tissierellia bacterium]|nr:sigma-70 family RNA polymerase sigma factor [Tissierellia bacterium]
MYEEINSLVESAKRGNGDDLKKLSMIFENLIWSVISKYRSLDSLEHLYMDAVTILYFATLKHDIEKSNFPHYFKNMLRFYFLDRSKRREYPIDFKDYHENFVDELEVDSKILLEEEYAQLNEAVAKLPDRQREIVNLLFFKNYSLKETAKLLNLSYQTIANTRNLALKNIKAQLKKGDEYDY